MPSLALTEAEHDQLLSEQMVLSRKCVFMGAESVY